MPASSDSVKCHSRWTEHSPDSSSGKDDYDKDDSPIPSYPIDTSKEGDELAKDSR